MRQLKSPQKTCKLSIHQLKITETGQKIESWFWIDLNAKIDILNFICEKLASLTSNIKQVYFVKKLNYLTKRDIKKIMLYLPFILIHIIY